MIVEAILVLTNGHGAILVLPLTNCKGHGDEVPDLQCVSHPPSKLTKDYIIIIVDSADAIV